jgi:uncharacterized protein (DUF58 family)
VRLFEARDDRTVRVLVDASASMQGPRWDAARKAAAAVAWASRCGLDRVQVVRLGDGWMADGAPSRGRSGFQRVLQLLGGDPGGATTTEVPPLSAGGAGEILWVLVSDLLVPDWEIVLHRLMRQRGEGHVLHVIDRREWDGIGLQGDLRLVDAETGTELDITADARTRAAHRACCEAWADDVAARCLRGGLGYLRLDAAQPIDDPLIAWLEGPSQGTP